MGRKNKTPEQKIAELQAKKDEILEKYNESVDTMKSLYSEYKQLIKLKAKKKEYNTERMLEIQDAQKDIKTYNRAIAALEKLTQQKTPPPTSNSTISIAQCTSFSKAPDNIKVTATKSQFNITPNTA